MTTTGQGPSTRDVDTGRLAVLLLRTSDAVRADVARAVESAGLTLPLARAVLQLDEPAPMRNLADSLGCDRSYVTGVADGLEERGLVQRVTGQDRRVKLLRLTPAGRDLRDELLRGIGAASHLLERLNDAERDALATLLSSMADGLLPSACPIGSADADCPDAAGR